MTGEDQPALPPDVSEVIDPEEARRRFGRQLEAFAEALGKAATEHGIAGFSCMVVTPSGICSVSGGDPNEEWRATLRAISRRVVDELGQVLVAKGLATKGLATKPGSG